LLSASAAYNINFVSKAGKLSYSLIFIAIAFALAFFCWRFENLPTQQTDQTIETVNQEDVVRMGSAVDDSEKAKSLERMSFQNPLKAQEYARLLANAESAILRAAASKVAGSFPGEEWDRIVLKGLKDKDSAVRIATLRGMRRQPTEKRQRAAVELLKAKKLDLNERLWGELALMPEPGDKKILALLEKVDRSTQSEALMELYKSWPKQSELFPLAEKVLHLRMENQDYLPSFHYLSAYAPEVLTKFLADSSFPDSRMFLLETVGFVKQKCPQGWPAILKKVEAHSRVDEEIQSEIKACASACPIS
jgi:hypothetical protein